MRQRGPSLLRACALGQIVLIVLEHPLFVGYGIKEKSIGVNWTWSSFLPGSSLVTTALIMSILLELSVDTGLVNVCQVVGGPPSSNLVI